MPPDLPAACALLGDKGYDSGAYRAALIERGISPVFRQEQSENSPQYTVKHIQAAPQGRKPVFKTQGLETHSHAVRPPHSHIPLSNPNSRNHHLLVQSMSPDPRSQTAVIQFSSFFLVSLSLLTT